MRDKKLQKSWNTWLSAHTEIGVKIINKFRIRHILKKIRKYIISYNKFVYLINHESFNPSEQRGKTGPDLKNIFVLICCIMLVLPYSINYFKEIDPEMEKHKDHSLIYEQAADYLEGKPGNYMVTSLKLLRTNSLEMAW